MRCRHAYRLGLALAAIALTLSAQAAAAASSRYLFDGGTSDQRDQVRQALQASSFDWGIVPGQVTVHIRSGITSQASPRHVWLDAGLLDSGVFSWGVVQHEFAHQIDYLVLDDAQRAALQQLLGGRTWCSGPEGFQHDENACERFATSISWAYWPSAANVFDPSRNSDERWLRAVALRSTVSSLLGFRDPFLARQTLLAARQTPRPLPE
jgi:hypothetical protein